MSEPRDHDLGTKLKSIQEKDLAKPYEHGLNYRDKVIPTYARLSHGQQPMDFNKFLIYCKILTIPLIFLCMYYLFNYHN